MRILFLENHAIFAQTVIQEFLSAHSVVVVPSVDAGIACFRKEQFDAVLVDYDLDDAKGDTFVRHVRAQGNDVPLVAVSAREEGNAALVAAGASAVCHKANFRSIPELLSRLSR